MLKSGKSLHQNIAHQFINSIFTTGDHKDNEDERIYTLKDRFLSGKRNRDESEEKSKSKEKNKDKELSHSRSHNRDRERNRDSRGERERERGDRDHSCSSHSHSRDHDHDNNHSRSHSRSRHDKERRYHKKDDTSLPRPEKKTTEFDPSHNFSYEENGQMKISTDFIVPDHLVSLLIGKNGENVRAIMSKSGAIITFSKEVIIIVI